MGIMRQMTSPGHRARRFVLPLVVLLGLGIARWASAATDETASPAPAPATVAPHPLLPYRLGIGDMLQISVYGEEASFSNVPVDPSGHIAYRIVGTVMAAGKTIDELRAELQEKIGQELRHAVVTVTPIRFGSQNITVLGMVRQPGVYPLRGRTTLYEGIGIAGGLLSGSFRNSTADLFDLRHAALLRRGEVVPVDFSALIERGDATQNVELQSDDVIIVPSALQRNVYILGEVNYSRTIGMITSVTLLQALAEARGFRESASGQLVIVRGPLTSPQAYEVDGLALLKGKVRDVQLAPGDIVYAPRPPLGIVTDIAKEAVSAFAKAAAVRLGSDAANATIDQLRRNDDSPSSPTTRGDTAP